MSAWVLPFSELARKPALLERSSSMQPRRTSHARSFSSTRLWPSTAQLCTRPFSAFGLKGSRQFVPLQLIDARHLSAWFVVDGLPPTWEVQRTWEVQAAFGLRGVLCSLTVALPWRWRWLKGSFRSLVAVSKPSATRALRAFKNEATHLQHSAPLVANLQTAKEVILLHANRLILKPVKSKALAAIRCPGARLVIVPSSSPCRKASLRDLQQYSHRGRASDWGTQTSSQSLDHGNLCPQLVKCALPPDPVISPPW